MSAGLGTGLGAAEGLLAALLWGVGDFCGAAGARSAGSTLAAAFRVILLSHSISLVCLLSAIAYCHSPAPHGAPLAWGLGAGLLGGLSLSAFYVALAEGAVGGLAAVSGLLAAAIPALVSALREGAPDWQHRLGFTMAGVAIWLIAAGPAMASSARATWLAIGAGAGFGFYFVALKFAGPSGVIWSMASARIASVALCSLLSLVLARRAGRPSLTRATLGWAAGTALFDTSGNLLFVASTRTGRLDIAAVLASLYPASTIVLAGLLYKERLTLRQRAGLAVATAAVVLVVL